jgi:hypothetical protein
MILYLHSYFGTSSYRHSGCHRRYVTEVGDFDLCTTVLWPRCLYAVVTFPILEYCTCHCCRNYKKLVAEVNHRGRRRSL